MLYRFIDSQRTDFDVKTLCRVCEVSRTSFYDWVTTRDAGPDASKVATERGVPGSPTSKISKPAGRIPGRVVW